MHLRAEFVNDAVLLYLDPNNTIVHLRYHMMRDSGWLSLIAILVLLPSLGTTLLSQDGITPPHAVFLRSSYQAGAVMPTNDFVKGKNKAGRPIDAYQAARIEIGWQTNGDGLVERVYNYPYLGLGLYGADFFNDEEVGQPSAVYGFVGLPFKHWERFSLGMEFGLGLTWNWQPYDPVSNPYNLAMGNFQSVYIDVGIWTRYRLSRYFDLGAAVTFSHFSNGGSRKPNSGLNMLAPQAFLAYKLDQQPDYAPLPDAPAYDPHNEIDVFLGAGVKNNRYEFDTPEEVPASYSVDYLAADLNVMYMRRFTHMAKAGVGVDLGFDGTSGVQAEHSENGLVTTDVPKGEKVFVGLYGAYEQVIGRLSLSLGIGYYVLRKHLEQDATVYQRLGVKYHVFPDTFVGLNVRVIGGNLADFLEWHIGQRFRF